jgi:NCAIR mutase (PurE)-related protein
VVCAGTGHLATPRGDRYARLLGNEVEEIVDVGVRHPPSAGLDESLREAAVVTVAGMEGAALGDRRPGLRSGHRCPDLGRPRLGGVRPVGMSNSCASGVTVVIIDNGFGAVLPPAASTAWGKT